MMPIVVRRRAVNGASHCAAAVVADTVRPGDLTDRLGRVDDLSAQFVFELGAERSTRSAHACRSLFQAGLVSESLGRSDHDASHWAAGWMTLICNLADVFNARFTSDIVQFIYRN